MCENSVAAQQIAPANRLSNEHKKHIPSDDPWLTYGAFGPLRRFAAMQQVGSFLGYGVVGVVVAPPEECKGRSYSEGSRERPSIWSFVQMGQSRDHSQR